MGFVCAQHVQWLKWMSVKKKNLGKAAAGCLFVFFVYLFVYIYYYNRNTCPSTVFSAHVDSLKVGIQ